ncbi:hypothetical protein CNMCM5623_007323 [Aspergillus felis]|uniref:Uncharacterized protein n=1 Tax=Aspergillus felis TaxID=1287682 RepID=A0A8H6R355_9EURO|nr:hypothetical protein CNMCM5623_007323 [Aspergillus felis]KAF7182827.1 hypothetical protein CNMCM7691_002488 [Aspergillus felis]
MRSNHSGSHRFTVKVKGPHETENADHRDLLLAQLKNIPRDIQFLGITEDTPSDVEWELLGNYFSNIKDLEMRTGFNEELNDAELPTHWPLERLLVSDACAEVFLSPFVLEGRVKHLVLLLTSGLRFEGPTSAELYRANTEAISRGEKEAKYMTVRKGTPEEKKIELVFLPELVAESMNERFAGTRATPPLITNTDLPLLPKEVSSKMEKLEIFENDAIDAFNRMFVALPHVVENLSTLNIRSTHGLDFHFTTEEWFACLLPELPMLRTFVLSVGDIFKDENLLPTLYSLFPPNLSTLRFRGPASLGRSGGWPNWVKAFASSDFLPNLKRMSFVLDLHYEAPKEGSSRRELVEAPEDILRDAQDACKQLYQAVEQRGVILEPFQDKWSDHCALLKQVDERWMQL